MGYNVGWFYRSIYLFGGGVVAMCDLVQDVEAIHDLC